MTADIDRIASEILLSGVDDLVHVPEAIYLARKVMGGVNVVSEEAAFPVALAVVKHLIREELIQVGDAVKHFQPWVGSIDEIESRIDDAAAAVAFPVVFGDLFWIANTPAGDMKVEESQGHEAVDEPYLK